MAHEDFFRVCTCFSDTGVVCGMHGCYPVGDEYDDDEVWGDAEVLLLKERVVKKGTDKSGGDDDGTDEDGSEKDDKAVGGISETGPGSEKPKEATKVSHTQKTKAEAGVAKVEFKDSTKEKESVADALVQLEKNGAEEERKDDVRNSPGSDEDDDEAPDTNSAQSKPVPHEGVPSIAKFEVYQPSQQLPSTEKMGVMAVLVENRKRIESVQVSLQGLINHAGTLVRALEVVKIQPMSAQRMVNQTNFIEELGKVKKWIDRANLAASRIATTRLADGLEIRAPSAATKQGQTIEVDEVDLADYNDPLTGIAALPKEYQEVKVCSILGCTNKALSFRRDICEKHYGKRNRKCSAKGCTNFARLGGVCIRHGAVERTRRRCVVEGCTNYEQCSRSHLCQRHGAPKRQKIRTKHVDCSVEGCQNKALKKSGKCEKHSGRTYKTCLVEGCAKWARVGGVCIRRKCFCIVDSFFQKMII